MKRFLKYPDKMDFYADENVVSFVKKWIPIKKIWVNKLDRTQEKMEIWYENKKNKHNIRNNKFEMGNDPSQGVYGISYQEVDKVVNTSDQDWKDFLKTDSDGLTKTGQKLFQHAIESYVYCVLGAQAQTHWPIVGVGAKSLQSQDIFHKLVEDTIAQDNVSVSISNMRRAIKDTNVVLNMVVSPGIILIPSSMIILKEKIAGYNNALTLATNDMKFGKNINVNYLRPSDVGVNKLSPILDPRSALASQQQHPELNSEPVSVSASAPRSERSAQSQKLIQAVSDTLNEDKNKTQEVLINLFGTTVIIGLLIAKYLI